MTGLRAERTKRKYGFEVEATDRLCEDPTDDQLDALLCAVQAAWAWQNRETGFGAPDEFDALEGWIADPEASLGD